MCLKALHPGAQQALHFLRSLHMRNYPQNSPEAAARIVALVLISDGHVCRSEIDTLQRLGLERELGLHPDGFNDVVQALCEDLLSNAYGQASLISSIDDVALASLLDEVTAPALQHAVLRLAQATAEADHYLAEPEAHVLATARQRWGLHKPRPVAQLATTPWADARI
jgi:uncharacterized tellurite resistance protein B-like protein